MFGNHRNSGIKSLRNYAQAKQWHDNTPPIKGNGVNAGIRPLGHRNRPHFQIAMDGENVVCRCYNSDVVTFHPDNRITIIDDGYTTQTTANFIQDVLGTGAAVKDHSIVLFGARNPTRLVNKMVIEHNPNFANYTVIETGKHYTYTINRKRMMELRRMVAPFMQYAKGMLKLRENTFELEEVSAAIREISNISDISNPALSTSLWRESAEVMSGRMQKFLSLVNGRQDDGNWHNAFLWLARSAVKNVWRNLYVSESAFKQAMDDVLIALHPDVLVVTETPAGVIKVNKYARFKPFKDMK